MARWELTDMQKQEIIADYIMIQSARAVARKHGVSDGTVRRLVNNNADIARAISEKKEENTADILAHMELKKEEVCCMIDDYLVALRDKKKIEKATVNQLSTALGTVIDKFTGMNHNNNSIIVEHYIPGADESHEEDHD